MVLLAGTRFYVAAPRKATSFTKRSHYEVTSYSSAFVVRNSFRTRTDTIIYVNEAKRKPAIRTLNQNPIHSIEYL